MQAFQIKWYLHSRSGPPMLTRARMLRRRWASEHRSWRVKQQVGDALLTALGDDNVNVRQTAATVLLKTNAELEGK